MTIMMEMVELSSVASWSVQQLKPNANTTDPTDPTESNAMQSY